MYIESEMRALDILHYWDCVAITCGGGGPTKLK